MIRGLKGGIASIWPPMVPSFNLRPDDKGTERKRCRRDLERSETSFNLRPDDKGTESGQYALLWAHPKPGFNLRPDDKGTESWEVPVSVALRYGFQPKTR